MTLPASGQIHMSQVNTELGRGSTAQISLNDSGVRSLAGVASGTISLNNLHGKSSFTDIWTGDYWSWSRAGSITVGYYFNTDGTITKTRTGSANVAGMWANTTLAGGGNPWAIYFHVTSHTSAGSGSLGGNALDVWLPLSAQKGITISATSSGAWRDAVLDVYLSPDGGTSWFSGISQPQSLHLYTEWII